MQVITDPSTAPDEHCRGRDIMQITNIDRSLDCA